MAELIVAAVAAGVAGIIAINDTLMSRKGASSSRSTGVVFQNTTDHIIYLKGCSLDHGVWTQDAGVPSVIQPGQMAGWMSESQGFMTGTAGYAHFAVDSPANGAQVFVNWNNPYAGDNSYGCVAQYQGMSIEREGGTGDNASVIYRLQKA